MTLSIDRASISAARILCNGSSTRRAGRRSVSLSTRHMSSASKSQTAVSTRHRVLTLLHKTRTIIPRALPSTKPYRSLQHGSSSFSLNSNTSSEVWESVLSDAHHALERAGQVDARINIVFHSIDGTVSGINELFSALLVEPFSATAAAKGKMVEQRWHGVSPTIQSITIDDTLRPMLNENSPSSWLQEFNAPITISEIRSTKSEGGNNSSEIPSANVTKALLSADIPILVINALSLSSPTTASTMSALAQTPSTQDGSTRPPLIVLTGCASASTELVQSILPPAIQRASILTIDPWQACRAIQALHSSGYNGPNVIQRYQDDFNSSQLATLTQAIKSALSASSTSPTVSQSHTPDVTKIRTRSALRMLSLSTHAARSALRIQRAHAAHLLAHIEAVRTQVTQAHESARRLLFTSPLSNSSPASPSTPDAVARSLATTEKALKDTLDRLTWWRLLYAAGDVEYTVSTKAAQAWFRELEPELVMLTGRLAALQEQITAQTFDSLSDSSQTPLSPALQSLGVKTAVLSNSLSQLARSPSYPILSSSLITPLYSRLAQLAHPTRRLQSSATRIASGLYTGVLGSAGLGVAGWTGALSSGPLGAWGIMEMPTAVGIGVLGAVLSARWAVGRWERAKGRWRADWERVGQGLRRDLEGRVEEVVHGQVGGVQETMCVEVESAVVKMRKEAMEARTEIEGLDGEIERLKQEMQME